MRIILFGQKWLGEEVLKLADEAALVVGAVGYEGDRFLAAALARGIPALPPEAFAEWPQADLGLAAHYHRRIPPEALKAFRHGVVGYHPSLLPAYPGKRALEEAIAAGERETGGTLYKLDDSWDSGPVIKQVACKIRPGESPGELWRRALAPMGLELFRGFLSGFPAP
jgi:methionyl-tRNA formyltransferase